MARGRSIWLRRPVHCQWCVARYPRLPRHGVSVTFDFSGVRDQMSEVQSILAAGYTPLDIVSYRGRVWHAAGGTAGNVAAILGFLGSTSSLVADLGDDLAGRKARDDLRKANVSVDLVRLVDGMATPRLVHEISGDSHRFLFRCPRCHQRLPGSRPLTKDRAAEVALASAAPDVFFFDRVNAGTVLLAEHYAEAGSVIVLEPSRPSRHDLTRRALRVADVVKYADDRVIGLGAATPERDQIWIATSGAQGARYRVGKGIWHDSPAFAYPVVDAGGAGDWTTGGLIHTLPLRERRTVRAVADSLRWAQALAAVSCGAPGARGLARQQSAEAVLRAAQFLEKRGETDSVASNETRWSRSRVPSTTCTCCLQARESRSRHVRAS